MASSKKKILSFFFSAFFLLASGFSFGQSTEKIYSLFLYNFAQNLKWPDDESREEFVIGVIGSDLVLEELTKVAQTKRIGTSKLIVKEFKPGQSIDCHLLFYSSPKASQIAEITKSLPPTCILVFGKDGFAKDSGGIDLYMDSGKIKFKINQKSIQSKGIKIASSLLNLGIIV